MKIQIDLKSAVCGLVIGVTAMFAVGAGTSSNPAGKYQIEAGTTPFGIYTFVIDTQTGEVWGIDTKGDWHDNKADKFWGAK
jgi:hypothetical protein